MRESSRCPAPEILAAFVAGTLSAEELERVTDHLLTCDDCRFIVREIARTDREESERETEAISEPGRISLWWMGTAAAALIGILALAAWRVSLSRDGGSIATLVEASPRDGRYVEPRLSGGFPWAPLRSIPRNGQAPVTDVGQMKLIGAAGAVLEQNADDASLGAQRAVALAHLVAGHFPEAVRILSQLARSQPDAQIWSDLAAAQYMLAVRTSDAAQLAEALEAVDTSLRIEPSFPEALFNRALIVERLGVRQQARSAWERYLTVDRDSPWSREARQHLAALVPGADFRSELERQYGSLAADPRLARLLAARFPQDARVWGETEILGRWAAAVKRHDLAAAERHLRIAQAFGEELAVSRGDSMLQAASAAAEHANATRRMTLADAHVLFRAAQTAYRELRPAEAEQMFLQASAGFESAGSPVALLAHYFASNTLYDQGKIDESRKRLEALRAAAPPMFPAYRAQVEWQLGLALASRGQWGEAIRTLKSSIATFERLQEARYATSVREILAQVYDRIGDSHSAWQHRITALQELGRSENLRLEGALFAAARAAAANRQLGVSLALIRLQLGMTRSAGDDLLYVETLLLRARLHAWLDRPDAGHADLAAARRAIALLNDPAFIERMEAEYSAVEARLLATPQEAVARLDGVIAFHHVKGRRMFLPELYLERGRSLASLGRIREAASDFEAGIVELELQRATLPPGADRWGIFTAADELFDEAIANALARGDPGAAYAYSERARARELLESLGVKSGPVRVETRGATIIEYATLPSTLIIFVADDGSMRVVQERIDRASLEIDVEELILAAAAGSADDFRSASVRLYARLIAPVAALLPPGKPLVFVPDATLRNVSFPALVAPSGRHLIEDHRVVVSPSAAVYGLMSSRSILADHDLRLLLVAGARSRVADIGYLSGAEREATAIQAVYRHVVKLSPNEASRQEFWLRSVDVDVIHFIGHASADATRGAALLAVNSDGSEDRLDVHDISSLRLPRTRAVVLAACDTANGADRGPEGTISIARAFLASGVPSVIATLWPIDDRAAADFFPRIHRHLAGGVSAAEALRLAQIESIHRSDVPPFLWAAAQTFGS